ncbi:MAG TPA: aspartate kinase, partial [Acidimicrobiales bacterium]
MPLVVQKFGGSSVGDADRIRAVADHVARTRRSGDDVAVVVSAMGKTTDDLVRLAGDVSDSRPPRELDMLLSSG